MNAIDSIMKNITNSLVAAALGYAASIGLTVDSVNSAVTDPMNTNWNGVAHALFDTADVVRRDIAACRRRCNFATGVEAVVERMNDEHLNEINPQRVTYIHN